ncbi:hypothetical protein INS49_004765 [Diaporthe citri]|uniref:uncharacterized protein n=1 Tax=Diaporthe citri TaxID=83186 RepID=UPI001C816A3C|nr:uncharacterized protein INS49_004765 [Diaporthe citri]KAG6354161.1 hypothetical protein INS49_004765 [Diaporthe citri]
MWTQLILLVLVSIYFARPADNSSACVDKAVLVLPDIYGLAIPHALRMADSYARAGFFTVACGGRATFPVTDPIVETAIEYARNSLGFPRVGILGYCYSGYYSARFLAENRTVRSDATFAVTPSQAASGVDDTLAEIGMVSGPITYAFAEIDNRMPRDLVNDIVDTLNNSRATAAPYQSVVYGNRNHGFGLRGETLNLQADNSFNPEEVFAKESAFLQSVRWFDTYL